jgi:predicted membrane-bound spermidine synthase
MGLGFRITEASSERAPALFLIRTAVLIAADFIAAWSAGAHAGWFMAPSSLHAPLVVVVISVVALYGAGLPFYRFAYTAALLREFDASVLVALLASVLALGSLPIGLLWPSPWLTDLGFVIATTLTTGWFLVRALSLWIVPVSRQAKSIQEAKAGTA